MTITTYQTHPRRKWCPSPIQTALCPELGLQVAVLTRPSVHPYSLPLQKVIQVAHLVPSCWVNNTNYYHTKINDLRGRRRNNWLWTSWAVVVDHHKELGAPNMLLGFCCCDHLCYCVSFWYNFHFWTCLLKTSMFHIWCMNEQIPAQVLRKHFRGGDCN